MKIQGAVAQIINHAISLIDKVHDDGKLPAINILANRGKDLGVYTCSGKHSVDIKIRKTGPWPGLTTLHEIGHFIDHQALGSGAGFGSMLNKALDVWKNAVQSSKAVEQIKFANMGADRKQYFLSDIELFARSYAQYITEKSADPILLSELDKVRNGYSPWRQWSADDFVPIRKAFDQVFKKEGWL